MSLEHSQIGPVIDFIVVIGDSIVIFGDGIIVV